MLKRTIITVVNLFLAFAVKAQTNDSLHFVHSSRLTHTDSLIQISPAQLFRLPENFYSNKLPFFCNKELQIQKSTGIAIKFRLGSTEYVNKLEGKQ
jgi:hypothetical protein